MSQISAERDKEDLSEIDSLMLIRQIEGFYQNETLTDKAREILSKTAFNFKATMEGSVKGNISYILHLHCRILISLPFRSNRREKAFARNGFCQEKAGHLFN